MSIFGAAAGSFGSALSKQLDQQSEIAFKLKLQNAQMEQEHQNRLSEQMQAQGAAASLEKQKSLETNLGPSTAKGLREWSGLPEQEGSMNKTEASAAIAMGKADRTLQGTRARAGGAQQLMSVESANHSITGSFGENAASPFKKSDYPDGVPYHVIMQLQRTMKEGAGSAADQSRFIAAEESNRGTDSLAKQYKTLYDNGAAGLIAGNSTKLVSNLLGAWKSQNLGQEADGDKVQSLVTSLPVDTTGIPETQRGAYIAFTRSLVSQAARNARSDLGRVSQMEFIKELESMGSATDEPSSFYTTLENRKSINSATIQGMKNLKPWVDRFRQDQAEVTKVAAEQTIQKAEAAIKSPFGTPEQVREYIKKKNEKNKGTP